MAGGSPPPQSARGPGRPRKDGSPAQPKSAQGTPSEKPQHATKEQWDTLNFLASNLTLMAGEALHQKYPGFPNSDKWKQMRVQVTLNLLKQYGDSIAKNSVEISFILVWGLSFLMIKLQNGQSQTKQTLVAKGIESLFGDGQVPKVEASTSAAEDEPSRTLADNEAELAA